MKGNNQMRGDLLENVTELANILSRHLSGVGPDSNPQAAPNLEERMRRLRE